MSRTSEGEGSRAMREPPLLADHPALDLLNSAPRHGAVEFLGNGDALLAWLAAAGLAAPGELGAVRRAPQMPGELDGVAARVREFREWLRSFVTARAGRSLTAGAIADLGSVNALLARDDGYRQVVPLTPAKNAGDAMEVRPSALGWRRERRWRSPDDLLLVVADSVGDLVCESDFARVKHCEGPGCSLWFYDVSVNRTRRWCSMAICGNRAKAAAHRRRRRALARPEEGDAVAPTRPPEDGRDR